MNPTTAPAPPPRSSSSCHRHPYENFTGFCPSCLCERLTTLEDQSASSSTAITSEANKTKTTRNSLFPEIRRTKSFSASKNEGLALSSSTFYEPQRKSCDVRGRNTTLWSLFSIHDERQSRENDEEDQIHKVHKVEEEIVDESENNSIVEEEAVEIQEAEVVLDEPKPMKDHIDLDSLDSHLKKPSRSNFWSAASVLSRKWQKWRRKQKKSDAGSNGVVLPAEKPKPISRRYRETQSEIADYGYGRRSCDTDPRFSLDAGRISFDDPRYSFDEPRVSWDGYMIGRSFPRLPPMAEAHVPRCDSQISVEQPPPPADDVPGGSIQTREYYLDSSSSSKRRKSLDRSISRASIDHSVDPPRVSNYSNYSNSNSLKDDHDTSSEAFELGFRDSNMIGGEKKKPRKWRWKLWGFIHKRNDNDNDNDHDNDNDNDDLRSSVGDVGRSYSEFWQDSRREYRDNEIKSGFNRRVLRSNSSVSWRKSNPNGMINGRVIVKGKNRRTGFDQSVEGNRSTRYSPNHIDNGLLRFYLAPLSGSRRSGIAGNNNNRAAATSSSHLISRSMLGLY